LNENVLSKVVDKTDESIARARHEEEERIRLKNLNEIDRQRQMVESMLKFYHDDQKIKRERQEVITLEKQMDREKNVASFREFLKIVAMKKLTKDQKAQLHKRFWDYQAKLFSTFAIL